MKKDVTFGSIPSYFRVIGTDYNGCDGQYEFYCDDVFETYEEARSFVNAMNNRFDGYLWPRYRVEK